VNTKILMTASSLVLGVGGIAASFAPAELLASLGAPAVEPLPVLIQLLGAVYVGFALTNWTAKDNVIGGIYSRPIAIGNCVHFISGALALAKQQSAQGGNMLLMAALVPYAILAIAFTWLLFGSAPAQQRSR
jgi:hypothetical protein